VNRHPERQADSGDIDKAVTIWVLLASLLLAVAAYVLCESGEVEIAIAFGIVSLIGVNIPTVGYSWWRKHRYTPNLAESSSDRRKNGAI